ncbi:hypothetical protein LCGC14_1272200 [marine sediment metagenome]|uniref:Uncharacterized protein n=1 Tax=marine sediment metagenome TaxID=412755 RepID=A0A0F9P0Q8_9ZZZZ
MKQLKQPTDYTIEIKKSSWFGPFGYYYSSRKLIEIFPPKIIPVWFGIRKWFINITLNHEFGHTYGIRGCPKPWCLMFEAQTWKEKWKDIWWERVLMAFFTVFNRFDFCKECSKKLNKFLERV